MEALRSVMVLIKVESACHLFKVVTPFRVITLRVASTLLHIFGVTQGNVEANICFGANQTSKGLLRMQIFCLLEFVKLGESTSVQNFYLGAIWEG